MAEARWSRIWDLFHAALEQPVGQRPAWLAATCTDAALVGEVLALLTAHGADTHPLDRPPNLGAEHAERLPGERIDRYRIVRLLGRGGMGQVYLVERDDGAFRKQAALKLIDPLLADGNLVEALRRERELLARLDHPNIARLLDGGRDRRGQPYLVMEYVQGLPIDAWCRERGLGLAARLDLIASVCETVDYAHRHLVVHRDLKPGNILVTADGVPMLLDFGIARALDQAGDGTAHGERTALTPRYASPEQLAGEPVGTASDVYSLGVLLYELLGGTLAPVATGLSWAEQAQRLRQLATRPPLRPAARRMLPDGARLPRELDWICAKAMAPEQTARYRSAHALAEDLRALQAHRPVHARAPSTLYRLRKFARRQRVGLAVAAVLAGVLAAFLWRLQVEAARTQAALDGTRIERDRAERVATFLQDLFRAADPTSSGGVQLGAADILDRGRTALAQRQDLPDTSRAALLDSLARVYRNMGRYDIAIALLEEAAPLATRAAARGLAGDIAVELGTAQALAGQVGAARSTLAAAVASLRAGPPVRPDTLVAGVLQLAGVLQTLGDHEQAGRLFREAHALAGGMDPALRAESALRLGSWHWTAGELDAAAPLYAAALSMRRQQAPADLPELARTLDAAGVLEHARGRYAEALTLLTEALALRRQVLGEQHRLTADTLSNLGALHYDSGDDARAGPALAQALAIYAQILPPLSPVAAKAHNNLGLVRLRQRDLVQARALFEQALAAHTAAYGGTHARVAGNLNNLALVAESAGDLAAASAHLRRALAIAEAALGPDHVSLGYALTNLGRVLLWQGRIDEAQPLLERARALRADALPAMHPAQAESAVWTGHLYCRQGGERQRAGRVLLEEVLRRRQRDDSNPGLMLQTQAVIALCTDAVPGADPDLERRMVEMFGPDHPLVRALADR